MTNVPVLARAVRYCPSLLFIVIILCEKMMGWKLQPRSVLSTRRRNERDCSNPNVVGIVAGIAFTSFAWLQWEQNKNEMMRHELVEKYEKKTEKNELKYNL